MFFFFGSDPISFFVVLGSKKVYVGFPECCSFFFFVFFSSSSLLQMGLCASDQGSAEEVARKQAERARSRDVDRALTTIQQKDQQVIEERRKGKRK